MISLQHLAVLKLTETQRYDGNDPVIENVIFEADQMKERLEYELDIHYGRKPRRSPLQIDMRRYNHLIDEVSSYLFDVFTYEDVITTREHVMWKEYFHTLYEFVMIEDSESYVLLSSTLRYYDDIKSPEMVDYNDPCYPMINHLRNYFKQLKTEQENLTKNIDINLDKDDGVEFGMRMLGWTQEWRAIHDRLHVYNRIIEWSLM